MRAFRGLSIINDGLTINAADRAMLARVDADGAAMVTRAIGWCAIPSGSHHAEGLARQAKAMERAFVALGPVKRVPLADRIDIDARGDTVATPAGEALHLVVRPDAPRRVVLTGHYDTVYPAGSPFTTVSRRDDGALNGPGIADMKGGLSVMLGALAAFEEHPAAGALGYDVLLSPDEEIGSPGSAALLAGLAANAQLALTYEPALADGRLASARMGSGNFHLAVTGRATHVGRDFAGGRNAVIEAARFAEALHGLNGRREGVRVNVARIDGGGPLNMVPDRAVVRFNARFADAGEAAWLTDAVAAISARALPEGLAATLHGGITRPAKPFTDGQAALFDTVRSVGGLLGQPIAWAPSGGVCEGNNLFAAGLPSIDTLGVRGGDIHSEREFAWPDSFAERAELSALLLAKLADGSIDPAGFV